MGDIITRFERAGFKIVAMRMLWNDEDFFKEHYHDLAERKGDHILKRCVESLIEGPVVAMVLEGEDAIEGIKKMIGPTEPKEALPGTIRGDYSHYTYKLADSKNIGIKNLVHCSTSKEDAEKEVSLWFNMDEIHSYKTVHDRFVV